MFVLGGHILGPKYCFGRMLNGAKTYFFRESGACGIDAALRDLFKNIFIFPTRGGSGRVGSMFRKNPENQIVYPHLTKNVTFKLDTFEVNGANYFFRPKR